MSETRFSDIGKIEAITRLYEGTPFKPFSSCWFETAARDVVTSASKVLLEGIDFNLVYFPLKHLGYKSVLAVTGELYSEMIHPVTLSVVLGISAKLDFEDVKQIWGGIVSAAREHGYQQVDLDLVPSRNGLTVSVSAMGKASALHCARRPAAKSKDLICVSGSLGAAYLGMRVLENELKSFEGNGQEHPALDTYKMLVGSYLKPELNASVVSQLEDAEIYPSYGYFITRGLSDAVKRLSRDSGLGAKIYADKIPFEGNSFQLGKELDIDPVSAAMNGGDDYRLLFTIPILKLEKFRRDFQTFDIIGHLALPEAGTVLVTPEGLEMPMKAQGWND
ncbi:MAG: hypothetical protein MJZ04_05910 [Bacteroidales bacterium]|nr:hypothetical protein [Bacteroidales bacterium]